MEIKIEFFLKIENGNKLKDVHYLHDFCDLLLKLKEDNNSIKQIGNINIDGIPIWEWMYTSHINHDERSFLMYALEKISVEENMANDVLSKVIEDANCVFPKGLVGDGTEVARRIGKKYVTNEKEYYELKQFYAKQNDNKMLYKYLPECFIKLKFIDNKREYNLSKFSDDDKDELFKILNFLNDSGKEIFNALSRNVDKTIKRFDSTNGFRCSGGCSINKFVKIGGIDYELDFRSHFKIQNAHSDKRLYFSWGNSNVDSIVIGHIGRHWT